MGEGAMTTIRSSRLVRLRTLGAAFALLAAPSMAAERDARPPQQKPPSTRITTKETKVSVRTCVTEARKVLREVGFASIESDDEITWGVTETTVGNVVCVRRPHAGDCGGDGTTAVIMTAGRDAKKLLRELGEQFTPPERIDCGSDGNPVHR
jgi:hypothetical protein